jgi:hypothetical protein
MIRIGVRSFVAGGGYVPSDADALSFINAAGISDDTQKLAINTLVTDLKGYSIWDKMKAIYPFVGGTSSTHKWNLKNPADTDAAFRLVFSGGWTHSSTGALPNGTNGYADTFLNISTNLSLTNTHASYYSRTNISNSSFGAEIGVNGTYSGASAFILRCRNSDGGGQLFWTLGLDNAVFTSNTNGDGHFIGNSTSLTNRRIFRNGSLLISSALNNTGNLPNLTAILGAASSTLFSKNECAFASIGDGLTNTEAANFYTAVQAYQTTLSRNV